MVNTPYSLTQNRVQKLICNAKTFLLAITSLFTIMCWIFLKSCLNPYKKAATMINYRDEPSNMMEVVCTHEPLSAELGSFPPQQAELVTAKKTIIETLCQNTFSNSGVKRVEPLWSDGRRSSTTNDRGRETPGVVWSEKRRFSTSNGKRVVPGVCHNKSMISLSSTDAFSTRKKNKQQSFVQQKVVKDTHICSPFADATINDWEPPPFHGLKNSQRVFGDYYLTGKELKGKLFVLDFYFTIEDDIKNFRTLSPYQMSYIKTLGHEEKQELFNLYNNSIRVMSENLAYEI